MLRQTIRIASIAFKGSKQMKVYEYQIPEVQQFTQKIYYQFSTYPKHKKLTMPALSPTMDKGNIMKWLKKEGDPVSAGDCICEVETDKATVGFEVQEDGFLAKILLGEGTKGVSVGQLVAIVVPKKGDVPAFANFAESETPQAASTPTPPPAQEVKQTATPPPPPPQAPVGKTYPKHTKLGLPALSPTMDKGNLMKWLKQEGDKLSPGDVIAEIETDKATVGFEIQEDGYLAKILVAAGTKDISLGTVLAVTTPKKDNVKEFANFSLESQTSAAPATHAPEPTQQTSQQVIAPTQTQGDRIFVSPLAKTFAQENGVSLQGIKGSGIEGSIIKQDVVNHLSSGQQVQKTQDTPKATQAPSSAPAPVQAPAPKKPAVVAAHHDNPYEDIDLTNIRQIIAKRLSESKQTIPHYYTTVAIIMDKLLTLREQLNKQSKTKISVNDFVIKASALALRDIPAVNSQWNGTFIRKFHNADISIAVSTDTGLITPIIFNAGAKGLSEIAANAKELAEKARTNKLKPNEFQGGTFTISNLGMFGVDQFQAVINPPQAAILAVGRTNKVVVPGADGQFLVEQHMNVTISCDHRVVDGAVGAQWLQRFKIYMEDPVTMLL